MENEKVCQELTEQTIKGYVLENRKKSEEIYVMATELLNAIAFEECRVATELSKENSMIDLLHNENTLLTETLNTLKKLIDQLI